MGVDSVGLLDLQFSGVDVRCLGGGRDADRHWLPVVDGKECSVSTSISPYLTTAEAAEVLRFTGVHAPDTFVRYAKRKGITFFYRDKTILVTKADVVRSLDKSPRRKARETAAQQVGETR